MSSFVNIHIQKMVCQLQKTASEFIRTTPKNPPLEHPDIPIVTPDRAIWGDALDEIDADWQWVRRPTNSSTTAATPRLITFDTGTFQWYKDVVAKKRSSGVRPPPPTPIIRAQDSIENARADSHLERSPTTPLSSVGDRRPSWLESVYSEDYSPASPIIRPEDLSHSFVLPDIPYLDLNDTCCFSPTLSSTAFDTPMNTPPNSRCSSPGLDLEWRPIPRGTPETPKPPPYSRCSSPELDLEWRPVPPGIPRTPNPPPYTRCLTPGLELEWSPRIPNTPPNSRCSSLGLEWTPSGTPRTSRGGEENDNEEFEEVDEQEEEEEEEEEEYDWEQEDWEKVNKEEDDTEDDTERNPLISLEMLSRYTENAISLCEYKLLGWQIGESGRRLSEALARTRR